MTSLHDIAERTERGNIMPPQPPHARTMTNETNCTGTGLRLLVISQYTVQVQVL